MASELPPLRNQGGGKPPHSKLVIAAFLFLVLGVVFPAQRPTLPSPKPDRYDIDVRFEPEQRFLHARAKVTFRVEAPLSNIELELNRHLKILRIADERGRPLEFTRSGQLGSHKLSVKLAEPAPAGKPLILTFEYEGVLPRGPLDYITKEGILLRDESRWYPATDLAAFADHQISVGVPPRWSARATGQPAGSIGHGLGATYSWTTSRPVSSRSLFAIPWQGRGHCSPQPIPMGSTSRLAKRSACFLGPASASPEKLAVAAHDVLESFVKLIGDLGLSQLAMVPGFPGLRGAIGYSAPGFLVVSEDVIKYHTVPGWAPEYLPHEIAHQWFPIEVTLAQQDDGWLAESLAEYLAWRYLREHDPASAQLMVQRAMRDALEPEPLRPLALGLKLFAQEEFDVTYKTLYQRGLLVWRTLETVIDRERVDAALREYYKRFRGRSASVADFRKICEEISGRDLGWFFDYFLGATQIPDITLRRLPAPAPNEFAGEIVVDNVPPEFQVRVEMRLRTASGVVNHSVATNGPVTPFTVTLSAPSLGVTLDPDWRVLRWTEAARRNKKQWKTLQSAPEELENALTTRAALEQRLLILRKLLDEDPDDVAFNRMQFLFHSARLNFRLRRYAAALREFNEALAARTIEPTHAELLRAWARVYRARIAQAQGRPMEAQTEAQVGLKLSAPALDAEVAWPEQSGSKTTARKELLKFAPKPRKTSN
ncbi:MAG TPA: M1 family aminopeptidase [Candidatus Nitrosotenuis sp.]|nr:M1 family aminopeptidase [Candidatus Nitrosotenuis sp.]